MSKSCLVIGGGAIAVELHLPRLQGILSYDDVVVAEPNEFRRKEIGDRLFNNKNVRIVESAEKGNYGLIVIATPPKFHLDYFRKCIDWAPEFLIEKPMVMNAREAEELSALAKEKGKRVYVGLIRRSLTSYPIIRALYQNQLFGALESVEVTEGGVFNWGAVSMGSFSRDLNGGGVLMDTGPHTIDLLLQVFDDVALHSCWMDADVVGSKTVIEANATLDLSADGRVPIELSLSRNRVLPNLAKFRFEKGEVQVGVRDNKLIAKLIDGSNMVLTNEEEKELVPDFRGLFNRFYERFLLRHDNSGIGPEESLKANRVIDQAYESAMTMEGTFK